MGARGVGGLLVILWMACSVAVVAQTGLLYLNEEPISLAEPVRVDGSTTQVPLVSFATALGLDVSLRDGEIVLRGAGFRFALDERAFTMFDGVAYVALDWLLELVDGACHRVGGNLYVETPQVSITGIEATSESVTLRLSQFTGYTLTRDEQGLSDTLALTWPNCTLATDTQQIRLGESHIQQVRMVGTRDGVSVSIQVESGTQLAVEASETGASFVVRLSVADAGSTASVIQITDAISVHEFQMERGDLAVDYVYIKSWRDEFRLMPIVSAGGYRSADSVASMLIENGAAVALSLNAEENGAACLVMDGIPYAVPDAPAHVLAFDLFGRWKTLSSTCEVTLRHAGRETHVDGVNRPIAYGEVVAYAPGYDGGIARGIPGTFIALKIRENRVVSVYQGPFVPADTSAIVVVASGDAKAKLSLIELGDPIQLACCFSQAEGTFRHAVSCGPQLMADGRVANVSEATLAVAGGAVLACDWQGGLYLLVFTRGSSDATWNVLDGLASLPTVVKDAVLLSSSAPSALAYASDTGAFTLSDRRAVHLALGLIPIAP